MRIYECVYSKLAILLIQTYIFLFKNIVCHIVKFLSQLYKSLKIKPKVTYDMLLLFKKYNKWVFLLNCQ